MFMGGGITNINNNDSKEWLIEYKDSLKIKNIDNNIGKWILLIEDKKIEEQWIILYNYFYKNENNIIMIKFYNFNNKNILKLSHGFIMVYYEDSYNEKKIIEEGYMLLKLLNYIYEKKIYYRLNLIINTDNTYLYVIENYLYKKKCIYCDCYIENIKKSIVENVCKECVCFIKISQDMLLKGTLGNDYEKWFLLDDNEKKEKHVNIYNNTINKTYDPDSEKNEYCIRIYNKNINNTYDYSDELNDDNSCENIKNSDIDKNIIKPLHI